MADIPLIADLRRHIEEIGSQTEVALDLQCAIDVIQKMHTQPPFAWVMESKDYNGLNPRFIEGRPNEKATQFWSDAFPVYRISELEAERNHLHNAQSYLYIGKDGKPVLARDLEDRAEAAEKRVAELEAERDVLRNGIKRLSDEEELQAETDGGDAFDLVSLAAKLSSAEAERAGQWRLRRDAEGSRDAARAAADSLRMEREELRKAVEELKFALFSSDMTIKDRADQSARLALSTTKEPDHD